MEKGKMKSEMYYMGGKEISFFASYTAKKSKPLRTMRVMHGQ